MLSMIVILSATGNVVGTYTFLFLAGIGILILGAERLASGLRAKGVKRSSRLINMAIGAALIIYIGLGFFFPQFATKWLIIFLAFGLLANGIIRIFSGIKKNKDESFDFSTLGAGVIITAISLSILAFPKLGFILLIVMTAIALAVSGIQIIIAGVKDRNSQKHQSDVLLFETDKVDESRGFWTN